MHVITNKLVLLLTTFALLTVFACPQALAQQQRSATSNCILTRIGQPAGTPTELPPDCIGNSDGQPGGVIAPPFPSDIRQGIIDEFGITMNGFDQQHLQWAWEKFWDISDTRFNQYVRGSIIKRLAYTPDGTNGSRQVGCGAAQGYGYSVEFVEYPGEAFFKFLLTHELGHVMYRCNDSDVIGLTEHINAYTSDGPISWYGEHASECTGGSNRSEDYADTVAYYLNPEAGLASLTKCFRNPSVPNGDRNPLNPLFQLQPRKEAHYQLIIQLL